MELFKLFVDTNPLSKINSETACSSCDNLKQQLEEKHTVLMSLVNKGHEVQKELEECHEREQELTIELPRIKNENQLLSNLLNDYDNLFRAIIQERDLYRDVCKITSKHLENLEIYFADLHAKYEKSKGTVELFRMNQKELLDAIKQNESTILTLQEQYDMLKNNSITKLDEANETLNTIKKEHENEIIRLKTKIRKLDLTISNLQCNLEQKVVENNKLASLCDEFIYEKN